MTRAAIYARVSTDDQAREGHSLESQADRARELIAREGWTYTETFEDAGVSGSLRHRPALDRLLASVTAGEVDTVVILALDRLSRDVGHLREILLLLDVAGVRVVSTRESIDRTTPEGRLQVGILGEFAAFEREKIRARTREGINARAKSGKPWGEPSFGYALGGTGTGSSSLPRR